MMLILQFFCISGQGFCKNISYAKPMAKSITTAEGMVTMETSSGRVLYSKDASKRLPMASTTKILTAIVAIENSDNLDKTHEIPKAAVGIEGSSIYLRSGEHLSLRELLYGLMLRSGNDSAVAIAIIVGGSVENFVRMMNDFCLKMGLQDTHIVTVNGLHDDNHYTSAYDLAKITSYALQNETFSEIVSTKFKTINNETAKKDKHRYLKNKNRLLDMIVGADGVKTGYTKKAGRCFVGSATRDGMQVVCVVLNCVPMFEETADLLEHAFKEYKLVKLISKGKLDGETLNLEDLQDAPIFAIRDVYYPLNSDEISKVKGKLKLYDNIEFPHKAEDAIGEMQVSLENDLIFSEKIYTINIEKQEGFEDIFLKILKAF